jgi:serine/threonine-protein kinase
MGVVYKAQDTRLDRLVALKFLPSYVAASDETKARFLREAKAAAALNHPNICTIHGVEESDDGMFIVMECVQGGTLRKHIPFADPREALRIAIQIGEALQEAHAQGIIHRDIKADNVMMTLKGQAKVMDFGLARLMGSMNRSQSTGTVGTIGYMAPEVIQGGMADARSDIFSFGILLYEMLSGKLPFRGEHEAALIYSIVNEDPLPLQSFLPAATPGMISILKRALEKDPNARYQSAAEMTEDLRNEEAGRSVGENPGTRIAPSPPSRLKRMVKGAFALSVLVAILIGIVSLLTRTSDSRQTYDSLAVMPFENIGADPNTEYLSDGITETLINTLSRLSRLTVMSQSAVSHYKGKEIDPRGVGKALGVKAVLLGRVVQRGDKLHISAELVDASTSGHIWGVQYDREFADILAVQEEISKSITQQLSVQLAGDEESKLHKRSTENTQAYELYLKGRFYWNKRSSESLKKSVEYFNQAIEKDPGYALAHAWLALSYSLMPEYANRPANEFIPLEEQSAAKALELDASLAEPHAALASTKYQYLWDWAGAEKEFLRAIELNPNDPTTHQWHSDALMKQGRFDEALNEARRAQELDPLSIILTANVADVLCFTQRYDLAIAELRKTLDRKSVV